jgi:hypothetical protein
MALVVMALTATVVWAGKVHFVGSVTFSPGSLIASGKLGGLDQQDVTVILQASGVPTVICRNDDGDEVFAPNPPVVTATGSQFLDHDNYVKHKSPFHVETNDPTLTPAEAGCPAGGDDDDDRHASSIARHGGGDDDDDDDDWTAEIVAVKWDQAVITVQDTNTDDQLLNKSFKCKTTETKVRCKPKPADDDDDD